MSSSDSSSSSSSSSHKTDPKVNKAEERRLEIEKRKAAAEAAKQEKKARAEELKAQKEAGKAAHEEAKMKHKESLEAQSCYQSLFTAHSKLQSDCYLLPTEKRSSEEYENAKQKLAESESMIAQCLDAMKAKAAAPVVEAKALAASVKLSSAALAKMMPKKGRGRK